MRNYLPIFLLSMSSAWAQTIAVTSPISDQKVAGYAFTLTSVVASAPSADHVIYTVDSERECMTRTPPYSCAWNPFNAGNGSQHVVVASLYNALNHVLATSSGVTFTIANTIAQVDTNNTYSATWSVSVTGTNCSGTTWTGSCTLTAKLGGTSPPSVDYVVYVDGFQAHSSTSGSAYALNTAAYSNGAHKVVMNYTSGSNVWAQWERQITFLNGATQMGIELSARETWLCASAVTNCPSTDSITANILHTNGTTSAATISSCGKSSDTAVMTVALRGGACVETYAGNGSAFYTIKDSSGFTRMKWVFGVSSNVVPHFGSDAHFYNTWTPGKSFFMSSMFFTSTDLANLNSVIPSVTTHLRNYILAGWNTIEPPYVSQAPHTYQGVSQTTFQTTESAAIRKWCAFAQANDLYLQLDGDAWWRTYQFWATRGAQEGYSPPGTTYLAQQWGACTRAVSFWGADEINLYGGSAPYQAIPKMGGTVRGMVCTLGTCTVTTLSRSAGLFSFENGYTHPVFIITGASSAGFNSAPGTYYETIAINDTTFTFALPSGASNGSYNSSTDPNMLFEIGFDHGGPGPKGTYPANPNLSNQPPPSASGLYGGTYTSGIIATGTSGQTCLLASFNESGSGATATVALTETNTIASGTALAVTVLGRGFTAPPTSATASSGTAKCSGTATVSTILTDYARWNQYQTFATDYFSASAYPQITWPNAGGTNRAAAQNWMYDSRMSTFAMGYNQAGPGASYSPTNLSLPRAIDGYGSETISIGDHIRYITGNTVRPNIVQTQGTITDYGMQGYKVSVVSCTGNTFTFNSPHLITNIIPWSTRFVVSGGTCAGNYWVIAAPTPTTLTVWRNFGAAIEATTGRLTFENGDVYTISGGTSYIRATASATAISQSLLSHGVGPPFLGCDAGMTFTISETGTALDGTTGYLPLSYPGTAPCSTRLQNGSWVSAWGAVPSLSGTGGTATINANNYFTYGLNASDTLSGIIYQYATIPYCVVLRCAGEKAYDYAIGGSEPEAMTTASALNGYFNTLPYSLNSDFGDTSAGQASLQLGILDGTGNVTVDQIFWGMGTGNLLAQRLAKYEFQPNLPSPDYGSLIEAAAHSGIPGNMVILQNMAMNGQSVTVNLASCNVPGQQKIRYLADYSGIVTSTLANGVTSDTPTMTPGGTVAYLCPQNFVAELQQSTISARLTDVPNSTRIVVRYSYLPYWVDNGTAVADCASGTCTLPVDRQIGPIYYRLIYLDANSAVLAVSDIQTL